MSEFSRFVSGLASSLHATSILYVGCHDADDLSGFPADMDVCGTAQSAEALAVMVERFPSFEFRQADPAKVPYGDGRFDFVFGHKVFNYLSGDRIDSVLREMHRVSSKYITNFELFSGKGEGPFGDGGGHYRGMYSRWLGFQVRIISNVQMHGEIDPEQSQFTLVRKAAA